MQSAEPTKSFPEKMIDILNYGSLNLAMGLGYRAGLFDIMDAEARPRSAQEISRQANLNCRYVNEWLGIMVCGGIVELVPGDDGTERFFLPKAHGDLLARRAGSGNLGVYTQEIPLLTVSAMERVFQGFLSGEGIPYEQYPDFHDFMGQLGDAKHRQVLVDVFLPSVDNGRLVDALRRGIEVCDLGCAQGVATLVMAQAFPASHFTGIDISREALETARAGARDAGLENIRFDVRDAAELRHPNELSGNFDYITAFDAIHDQTRPLEALQGIYEILKADGAFSMIDIAAESGIGGNRSHPMGAFLYTVSLMHCMPVGLVDGGAGLGMMWGRQQAEKMLGEAGFGQVTVAEIPNDPFNLHFFCRK
ncbi:transcriptional regulator [Desulfosarcina ovata subsp. sediminis]|uniref:Transcriptional regulator n=1 Tax=Desulfosarcina ovata subsp. sediminis TaxID=885957 RepID=A0A5K7ZV95_9BACT|nr:class I SAM-dependent methyltransferase [Desulfosarcina ovata]BBO84157.1 transcriptional regulator [Desulfosarcina ovata subsp. sediminis]